MRANLETLDNGMAAIFMHRPHWQTSSVNLRVNAGGLHEDRSGPQGVAHYFEHVTFQGSRDFPDYRALNTYCDNHFIDYSNGQRNALTNVLETIYFVNSYHLEPAIRVVTNLALGPILSDEAIEKDRGGILSEAREVLTRPSRELSADKIRVAYGDDLNRLVVGTPDEVAIIDSQTLRAFHERHYRTGNMLLVICSGEDEKKQKSLAEELINSFEIGSEGQAASIDLEWLLPQNNGIHTFHDEKANLDAESEIAVIFKVDPTDTLRDTYVRNIANRSLNAATHEIIRDELGISYSASSIPLALINRNFGAQQRYESLTSMTRARTLDQLTLATTAIMSEAVTLALVKDRIERILQYSELQIRDEEQAPPSAIASNVLHSPSVDLEGYYDTRKSHRLIESISAGEIQEYIKKVTDKPAQVHITGPNRELLEQYDEWAVVEGFCPQSYQ